MNFTVRKTFGEKLSPTEHNILNVRIIEKSENIVLIEVITTGSFKIDFSMIDSILNLLGVGTNLSNGNSINIIFDDFDPKIWEVFAWKNEINKLKVCLKKSNS
jgi:hypothetical protein